MRFFPLQRIRKARGVSNVGIEASVESYLPVPDEDGFDFIVILHQPLSSQSGFMANAGQQVMAISHQWEPAIPPESDAIEESELIEEQA